MDIAEPGAGDGDDLTEAASPAENQDDDDEESDEG
jgi:hypothetical protein